MGSKPETARFARAITPTKGGPLLGFLGGVRLLGTGLGMWLTSPRLMLLGAIPALIVGLLYTALLIVLLLNLDSLADHLNKNPKHFFAPLGKSRKRIERDLKKNQE